MLVDRTAVSMMPVPSQSVEQKKSEPIETFQSGNRLLITLTGILIKPHSIKIFEPFIYWNQINAWITSQSLAFMLHLFRPNHLNKGKQPRDRRKLREKRRSTGVVHLPSTEVRSSFVSLLPPFFMKFIFILYLLFKIYSILCFQSTGGSTGEDDGDVLSMTAETRRNTIQNEHLTHDSVPEVFHTEFVYY